MKLSFRVFSFALFRFLQGSLLATISAVLLGIVISLASVLTMYVHQYAGIVVFLAGILAWIFLWLPFAERKNFGAYCGHIAVLTELITRGQVGNGSEGMFAYGKRIVEAELGTLDSIWDVNMTIRRAVNKLARVLNFADDLLPFDISAVNRGVYRIVNWSAPYISAVVMSYGLARGDKDLSVSGLDGLCYSAQNAKSIVKSALGAVLAGGLLMLPLWLCSLAAFIPGMFYLTLSIMGGDAGTLFTDPLTYAKAAPILFLASVAAGLILGYLFAWLTVKTVQEAFVSPMMITMLMMKFHVVVENQALDPTWRQRVLGADETLGNLNQFTKHVGRAMS